MQAIGCSFPSLQTFLISFAVYCFKYMKSRAVPRKDLQKTSEKIVEHDENRPPDDAGQPVI